MGNSKTLQKAFDILDSYSEVDFEALWQDFPTNLTNEEYAEEYKKHGIEFNDEELEILGAAWDEVRSSEEFSNDPDVQILDDANLEQISGGMKIILIKEPKYMKMIWGIIAKIKKKQN